MGANFLLADTSEAIDALASKKSTSFSSPYLGDVGLVLGGIFILTVLLFIWASYIRNPKEKKPRSSSGELGKKVETRFGGDGKKKIKVRRRRRTHRPRNPTLAETGGLPPPKPENESPGSKLNGEQSHNKEERL